MIEVSPSSEIQNPAYRLAFLFFFLQRLIHISMPVMGKVAPSKHLTKATILEYAPQIEPVCTGLK